MGGASGRGGVSRVVHGEGLGPRECAADSGAAPADSAAQLREFALGLASAPSVMVDGDSGAAPVGVGVEETIWEAKLEGVGAEEGLEKGEVVGGWRRRRCGRRGKGWDWGGWETRRGWE
jgi:hypothetical protein